MSEIICPNVLQQIEVNDIGLKLLGQLPLLFLNIRVTLAISQSVGNRPEYRD